jgi:hypothetical protein
MKKYFNLFINAPTLHSRYHLKKKKTNPQNITTRYPLNNLAVWFLKVIVTKHLNVGVPNCSHKSKFLNALSSKNLLNMYRNKRRA